VKILGQSRVAASSPQDLGMVNRTALADLNGLSVGRVERALAKGEEEFAGILRGLSSWDVAGATPCGCPRVSAEDPPKVDVHSLLIDFAACLDEECSRTVADCALHYLSGHRG
jgi:hypothetical protein